MLHRLVLFVQRAKLVLPTCAITWTVLACSLTVVEEPTPTVPPLDATVTVGAIINRGSPPTRTPVGAAAQLPQGQQPTPIAAINADVQTNAIVDPTRQARVSANLSNPDCPMPQGWTTYTVSAGDSLFRIAQDNDTTVDTLVQANCIIDRAYIEVGQVIAIPTDGTASIVIVDTAAERPTADTSGRILEAPSTANIYLVLETPDGRADGIEVGCGNMLVPVAQTVYGADTPENRVQAALEALFAIRSRTVDAYSNPLSNSSLTVDSVAITADGMAQVALIGEVTVAGVCEIPLLRGQIEQTILNDAAVTSAAVTLNGDSLDVVFSQR